MERGRDSPKLHMFVLNHIHRTKQSQLHFCYEYAFSGCLTYIVLVKREGEKIVSSAYLKRTWKTRTAQKYIPLTVNETSILS
jgi:hypothetical protein